MYNPIDSIKRDHRSLESLFKEYEDIAQEAYETKEKMVRKISRLAKLHMNMEERILYPHLAATFQGDDGKMVQEGIAEHDVAKRILEELSVTHPEDPQFDARVKVLHENTLHHIMEEEQELLPRVEKLLPEKDIASLGEEMHFFRIEHEDVH